LPDDLDLDAIGNSVRKLGAGLRAFNARALV
jgi:hypothetical protein